MRGWRRKRRGRKGTRTGHAGEKARVSEGAGQRGSFLNRRRQRSLRVKGAQGVLVMSRRKSWEQHTAVLIHSKPKI